MRFTIRTLIILAASAVAAVGQTPTITTIQNNYARIAEGASNYGIAQGSIFIVKGSNLADTSTELQNAPLQTTLQGVRIRITMGSTVTYAPLYYVLPTQLAAILPSTIAEGNGTVMVENNGRNSAPAPLKVVKSAFGMLAWDFENGTGRAIVVRLNATFAGNNATDTGNSLNSNEVVLLYGSGLGPISGDDAVAPTPANLDNIPITITIGGVNAEVQYHGRSTFAGLDQINVKIPVLPDNVYSCTVAMIITTNDVVANATTIPVAKTGSACTPTQDPGGNDTGTAVTDQEIQQWSAAGMYRIGGIGITRSTSVSISDDILGGGAPKTEIFKNDAFTATFSLLAGPDVAPLLNNTRNAPIPTAGTCTTYTGSPENLYPNLTYTSLDAGPSITGTGPAGTQIATRHLQAGTISYYVENIPNTWAAAGRYNVSGSGGPDVGSFSGAIDVVTEFEWTDWENAKVVMRNVPLTVHWVGGEPRTLVTIQGYSLVQATVYGFTCYANNTDGQLTIPANILSHLPASPTVTAGTISFVQRGSLAVATVGYGTRLTASGLDYFTLGNQWSTAVTTEYK